MNLQKALVIFLCLLVVSLGLYIRSWSWQHHFTHCDDLLVPTYMKVNKAPAEMEAHLKNGTQPKEAHWVYNKLRHAYRVPVLGGVIASAIKALSDTETICLGSTYAPVQFFFSSYLIRSSANNYQAMLENGRFVPFLLSVIGIFVVFLVCFKINNSTNINEKLITGALGAALAGFAWQNIIYAGQMSSYAIGPCFFALALLFFVTRKEWDAKSYFYLGIILSFCILSQYQFLIMTPAFFVGALVSWYFNTENKDKKQWLKAFAYPLLGLMTIVPVVYKLMNYALKQKIDNNAAISWNAGIDGVFFFKWPATGVFDAIIYTFSFFVQNTWRIVAAQVASTTPDGIYTQLLTGLVITLCVFGMFIAVKQQDKKMLGFWALFVSVMGAWIVLTMLQKITYSPTRHSLILQPMFVIGAVYGFVKALEFIEKQSIKHYVLVGFVALHTLLFAINMPENQRQRKEAFDAPVILSLLEKHKVTKVVTTLYTYNLEMLDWGRYESIEELEKANDGNLPEVVGFLSTRTPLDRWARITPYAQKMIENAEILEKIEVTSPVQLEYMPLIRNGANEVFFYILRLKRDEQIMQTTNETNDSNTQSQ